MKSIKTLGLAALMALIAMSFVGASSAMAEQTGLCTADETPCAAGNVVSHVHETSVVKATLLNEFSNIKCSVLFLGDTLGAASPLVIHGTFTYSGCTNFCSVSEENGPALIGVLKTGSELAKVTSEDLVHVNCPFLNCSYVGTGLEGHGLGPLISTPANGSVVISGQALAKEAGGSLCPSTTTLDIETTPLVKAYIGGGGPTMTCVNEPEGLYLAKFDAAKCEKDVYQEGKFELVINGGTMECVNEPEGLYLAKFDAAKCEKDVTQNGKFELVNI